MPIRVGVFVVALGLAFQLQAQEPKGIGGEERDYQQSQADAQREPETSQQSLSPSKARGERNIGTLAYQVVRPHYPGYPECYYDAVEECDLLAQKAMAQSTWWMNSAAWVGVVLSVIGLGLIARTMIYTRDAATHAKSAADAGWETVEQAKLATKATEEMLRTERAWLLFSHGQAAPYAEDPVTDERLGFQFQIFFMNMGRTPAMRVTVQSDMYVVEPGGVPKLERIPVYPDEEIINSSVGSEGTYAGNRHRIPFYIIDDALAGRAQILGWSRVYYEDIWGGKHQTEVTLGVTPIAHRAAYDRPSGRSEEMFSFHRWQWRNSAT